MAEEAVVVEKEVAPDVTVKIEDAPPQPEVVVEPKKDDAVGDLKAQFAELEKQSEEDRKAREQARAEAEQLRQAAAQAQREAAAAREALTTSNLDTINAALSAAQNEADAAKREYIAARERGDVVAEADANERWITARTELREYSGAKADLEARKKAPPPEPKHVDPVEAYIGNRTPRTASWLREHRDWVTDKSKNLRLTSAHYNALAEKLEPDTDEYFEFVEKQIGLRKSDDGEVEVKPHTRSKPQSRPVAPVTANGGSGSASISRGNTVTLSAAEAQAAQDGTHVWNYNDPSGQNKFKKGDPIGVQEFARRKQAMQARGDYDKTFTNG